MRKAGSSDLPAAVSVLTHAFSQDATTLGILGDPPRPEPMLRALFGALATHDYSRPHGAIDVAVLDGRVVGAAMWARPGRPGLTPAQVARMFGALAPVLTWRLVPLIRHERLMASLRPTADHWYLFSVGVAEPGGGVGGLLLDAGLERAGADPCYLEASTSASARLYARKGFEEIGRLPSPGDVELQYAMWRPPQR